MTESYTVYFEIYGKKLKATVEADDEIEAMEIVKSSVNIVKVRKSAISEPENKNSDITETVDNFFQDLLDLIQKKK